MMILILDEGEFGNQSTSTSSILRDLHGNSFRFSSKKIDVSRGEIYSCFVGYIAIPLFELYLERSLALMNFQTSFSFFYFLYFYI